VYAELFYEIFCRERMAPIADEVAFPAPGRCLLDFPAYRTGAGFGLIEIDQFIATDEAAAPVACVHHAYKNRIGFHLLYEP
jgi:hypothetical protein